MSGDRERVLRLWDSYRKRVMPANAGPAQVLECKRAFYAGAHALFSMLVTNVDENLEEPTDREMALMEDVSEELRLFGVSGGRG